MSFPIFIILDNHHPIPCGRVSPEAQPALLRSLLAAAKMIRLIIAVLSPELQLCPLIKSWPQWLLGCDFDATTLEEMKIKYYFRVYHCMLSVCVLSLLFKVLCTLWMFACKTDSAWHIWVCKSTLSISSKHFFLFLGQEKIIRCTQLLFAS